ncbi:acetyl-CoA carboxylase biotin carboxyl carrier protein subunit [Kitasatospora sp. NPDC096147]|uniref:acetyl-CoA carboxylase biotin carboxyl carrier protein subunit n=1 Tax=Kitasatospora sp. NPDC096147 TaxID=3364093 RepID=UPI003813173E
MSLTAAERTSETGADAIRTTDADAETGTDATTKTKTEAEAGTETDARTETKGGSTSGAQSTAVAAARAAAVLEPGLDRPVGLVGARLRAAAAALLLVVGAGGGWLAFGTLPHTLPLPAVLAHGAAPETVRADRPGALLAYRVSPGAAVTEGQTIAVLRTAAGEELTVPAPQAGTVTALLAAPGATIAPGAALAALDAAGLPDTVRLFATSLEDAGHLVPGRTVLVPVPGAGTVQATITAVDPLPVRADSLDGTFPVPLPGVPTGAAPVWTARAELPYSVSQLRGPVPLTVAVDLGARHPYQAVFGTGAGR